MPLGQTSEKQPDFFGEASPAPQAYVPKPQHVRNRFIDFLAQMSAAQTWPWEENQVAFYRERVWPYLYEKLPDAGEAADWKRRMEIEAARLDAGGARAPHVRG